MPRPELDRLIEEAKCNPPNDAELREQAVSWARGELLLQYPDMSEEEADRRARNAYRRQHIRSAT